MDAVFCTFVCAGKKVVGADACMSDRLCDLFLSCKLQIVPVESTDAVRPQGPDAGDIFTAGQAGGLHGLRMVKDLLCRPACDKTALMHEQQMVAELVGLVAVVGDQDRETFELLKDLFHLQAQFFLQEIVHGGKRLIKEQGFRMVGHDAGQSHSLLLSAGELCRAALFKPFQLEGAHHFLRALLPFLFTAAHTRHDVLFNSHRRKQGIILEKISHTSLLGSEIDLLGRIKKIPAAESDQASVRGLYSRNAAQCHTLTAAGCTQDPDPGCIPFMMNMEMEILQLFFKIQYQLHFLLPHSNTVPFCFKRSPSF